MMRTDNPAPNLFELATGLAPGTELAVLDAGVDPQVHLSRVDRAAPYFLLHAKDSAVSQMAGTGTLELRHSTVLRHRIDPGDVVYLPAGTAYRFLPDGPGVQIRYSARRPGAEAVGFYCADCATPIWQHAYDPDVTAPERGRAEGCRLFAADAALRRCPRCGAEAPDPDRAT